MLKQRSSVAVPPSLLLGMLLVACAAPAPPLPAAAAPLAASSMTSTSTSTPTPTPTSTPTPTPTPSASADPPPPPATLTDKILATLHALVLASNAHDASGVSALYAPDVVKLTWGDCNRSGHRQIDAEARGGFTMFPDSTMALRRVFVKGNEAVVEISMRGTNTGPSPGPKSIPATGKAIGYVGVRVMTFTDEGLIRDERDYFDAATLAAQLGSTVAATRPSSVPDLPLEVHFATGTDDERKNAAVARTLEEAFRARDAKSFGEACADDVVWDDLMAPAAVSGRSAQVGYFRLLTTAFPDLKANCDSWGVEDYVVEECSLSGTNRGPVTTPAAKHAPTGDRVVFHQLDVFQIKDGKANKAWSYGNRAELGRKLGWSFPSRGEVK